MKLIYCLFFSLAAATSSFAGSPEQSEDALPALNTVIGKIGEQNILLSDVEDKEINRLRSELYEALLTAFQTKAVGSLRENKSEYNQYQIPKISEKEIKAFYRQNQLNEGHHESLL